MNADGAGWRNLMTAEVLTSRARRGAMLARVPADAPARRADL
jgi:hypothetical protein